MANNTWTSPKGLEDLKKIIRSQVPWPASPHDWQVTATACALNGLNQLVVTACGDGKTAAAYLPLLVLEALAANRALPRYGSRVPERPVMLIVTPLSDLGHSQVSETPFVTITVNHLPSQKVNKIKRLGIAAVALDVESIKNASLEGHKCHKGCTLCSLTGNLPQHVGDCQIGKPLLWNSCLDHLMLILCRAQ